MLGLAIISSLLPQINLSQVLRLGLLSPTLILKDFRRIFGEIYSKHQNKHL